MRWAFLLAPLPMLMESAAVTMLLAAADEMDELSERSPPSPALNLPLPAAASIRLCFVSASDLCKTAS